jgi:hypothetical protein
MTKGLVGRFSFNAELKNITTGTLSHLRIRIITLRDIFGNTHVAIDSFDQAAPEVKEGQRLFVGNRDTKSKVEVLGANGPFLVRFDLCIFSAAPFTFLVDVEGAQEPD